MQKCFLVLNYTKVIIITQTIINMGNKGSFLFKNHDKCIINN
jgi:hypothetical protein